MTNNQKNKEITEVLGRFGMSEHEQLVFLSLLRQGQSTLSPIAKDVRLPLSTTQSIIKRLTEQGLIQTTLQKSKHIYNAVDPKGLIKIVDQQKKELETILPLLSTLQNEQSAKAKIRVYYNDQMTEVFNAALGSKKKFIYEIVAAKDIQDILGERFHFTKKRVEKDIRLKSLRVESREIKKYSKRIHAKELRESRFLPRQLTFNTSILVWDHTVAFLTTESEGLAWTVESAALTKTIIQIFDLLWELSRPMITAED